MNYTLVVINKKQMDITVRGELDYSGLFAILTKLGYSVDEVNSTVENVKKYITELGQSNTYGFFDKPTVHIYASKL